MIIYRIISLFSVKVPLTVIFFCFIYSFFCSYVSLVILIVVIATMMLYNVKSLSHSYPGLVRKPFLWLDSKHIITLKTLVTLVKMFFFFCFKCRQDRHPIQTLLLSLPPPRTHTSYRSRVRWSVHQIKLSSQSEKNWFLLIS